MSFIITFLVIIASIDSFWWLISRVCCLDPAQETKELGSVSRPWGRRGYSVPNLNLNLNLYSTPQQLQRPSSDELMNLRLRKVIERWTYWWIDSWVCLFVSETINFVSFCGRGGGKRRASFWPLHRRDCDILSSSYTAFIPSWWRIFLRIKFNPVKGQREGGWVGGWSRKEFVTMPLCLITYLHYK